MFNKNKKAQGLSIHTIIIAILALIVLVVLISIFTGQVGKGKDNINSCVAKGYDCSLESIKECTDKSGIPMTFLDCDGEKICCNLGENKNEK